ncbi:glycosyl hydrolase 2 galactose-binding domain-containing protein [Hamadaea tsunoensis]|uniref:glycosyl hydrolase 2 galactose-binding domain-containing protein n=1 Tax=Hamadaea tsunoensis TaxID=53368 RepID=UPI0004234065|nr:beta galactosidase jelly roll domain-containing protein [Hamadaea tsunoensis]
MKRLRTALAVLVTVLAVGAVATPSATAATVGSSELTGGWALRSATGLADTGATISQVGYSTAGWNPVTLPTTVLGGLVANNVYSNIYFGTNLQNVPDLTGQNWWYRGQFTAAAANPGQIYWLRFKGISYRAQVWLNGQQLDANAVGSMVVHEYNVTGIINAGGLNALAVRVTPPAHNCNDLSFCTVDWNPEAPDMNAGLWGRTLVDTTGAVAIRDPYVKTVLPLPATNSADLTVYADAVNATAAPVTTTVSATITKTGYPTISVSQTVTLNANERREIVFDPVAYPQLHVANPALWWPYQFGSPELYQLTAAAAVGGSASDSKSISFGVRQFTDYRTTVQGTSFAGYKVNGQNILFRGGGYVWDMLQRWDTRTNAAHVQYTKDMGLNTIRLEGTLGNEELYDLADQAGVMIMPGFVCCSAWENDSGWSTEQAGVATASLDSQMRALRAHASSFVWAYGSDQPPTAAHLTAYKNVAAALHWQNPTLDNVASYSNANAGVKMDGPYKWEPPVLWWDTTKAGSAFGTTAEEGTETPPPLESLQRFLSPADQWPIGTAYNYHAGKPGTVFDNNTVYTASLNARYGTASGAADYSKKSELANYENTRAFFEAWSAHEFTQSFGTIFWMLNNSWPSVHWNLYDYYLKPGGGYFGTKKATEPVHIAYDYATRNVDVINSTLAARGGLTATATYYNVPDLSQKYTTSAPVTATANANTVALTLPATVSGLSSTYLLRLRLTDAGGALVSDNLYWYSTVADALGRKSNWYMTAIKTNANLTGLSSLAADNAVTASATRAVTGGTTTVTITLTNTSPTALGFFLRPEITAGNGGNEVTPVTYSDNYVSLFPGESKVLTAAYQTGDLGGQAPYLRVRGFNVPTVSQPIP